MLYDPKWEVKTKEPTLSGFVAWLETQDPQESFDYWTCDGRCAVDLYLATIGSDLNFGSNNVTRHLNGLAYKAFLMGEPTFGGLLEIARDDLADC